MCQNNVIKPAHVYYREKYCTVIAFPMDDQQTISSIENAIRATFEQNRKGVCLSSRRLNQAYKRNGKKKTSNHYRRTKRLRRAYERDTNRWMVHEILSENDFIEIQDEMIHNWQTRIFGRQVQQSAMGYIKAKLKTYVISRSYPST